jgi:hypothetical protein
MDFVANVQHKQILYSNIQKKFLENLSMILFDTERETKYILITELYNQKFPTCTRTKCQLKDHLLKSGRKGWMTYDLTECEKWTFFFLKENENQQLNEIAIRMSKSYNAIKNYYQQQFHYWKCRNITFEEEMLSFQDDRDFYGTNEF